MGLGAGKGKERIIEVTAIILSGGRSSRMGADKAFLEIGGTPLIEREMAVLKRVFKKVILVVNSQKKFPLHFGERVRGLKIVEDIIKDYGPLGGIHAGLLASGTFQNFVVACDMPFLNEKIIRYMTARSGGCDILVPKIDSKFHPLFGVYSKNCIPVIEALIKEGLHRVASLYTRIKTGFVSREEIEGLDKGLESLVNINTKEDLESFQGKGAREICRR